MKVMAEVKVQTLLVAAMIKRAALCNLSVHATDCFMCTETLLYSFTVNERVIKSKIAVVCFSTEPR